MKATLTFAGLALGMLFVSGCTEEAPPDTPKPSTSVSAPASKPAGDMKPGTPTATTKEPAKP
jgi:hypothetical protein